MAETPTLGATGLRQKTCPRCAEDIDLLARWCPWCGAHFAVTSSGYCTSCHLVSESDSGGRCKTCGTILVDFRIESELIVEPTPLPVISEIVPEPVAGPRPGTTPMGTEAVEPPAPVAVAVPPPTAPAVTPSMPGRAVGSLRAGTALSGAQNVVHEFVVLAAVAVLWLFIFQFEFHSLALAVREQAFLKEIAYLGPGALIATLLIFFVLPQRMRPKGVGFRFARGRREKLELFKSERKRLGVAQIVSARWYRARNAIVVILWLAGIGITLGSLATLENMTLQPGAYIALGSMVVGLLSTLWLLVSKRRTLRIDDVGHLFEAG